MASVLTPEAARSQARIMRDVHRRRDAAEAAARKAVAVAEAAGFPTDEGGGDHDGEAA